jgi:hypothetical protein
MKINVANEVWFKEAPFHQVKMLGVKFLEIPAARFENKQAESFKRALVRQAYKAKHEYGEEFEIAEPVNPFGTPNRKSLSTKLVGQYAFVKNGLRAPEGDTRWKMMECMARHTSFDEARKCWTEENGTTRYKSTGALEYDFDGQMSWALRRGWIIKV